MKEKKISSLPDLSKNLFANDPGCSLQTDDVNYEEIGNDKALF